MSDAPSNGHDTIADAAAPNLAWAISTSPDLKRVEVAIPYGDQFFQSNMSIEDFAKVASVFQQVVDAARSRGALPEVVANAPRVVMGWGVGRPNTAMPRKTIALMIDPKLPTNQIWLLADVDALKIADAIEQEVFRGLPEADKLAILKESGAKKPALILPPGTPIKGRN